MFFTVSIIIIFVFFKSESWYWSSNPSYACRSDRIWLWVWKTSRNCCRTYGKKKEKGSKFIGGHMVTNPVYFLFVLFFFVSYFPFSWPPENGNLDADRKWFSFDMHVAVGIQATLTRFFPVASKCRMRHMQKKSVQFYLYTSLHSRMNHPIVEGCVQRLKQKLMWQKKGKNSLSYWKTGLGFSAISLFISMERWLSDTSN